MGQQRHVNYKLKTAVINAAKPQDKTYTLTDGGGLYIEVLPGGSKVWRYSFRMGDKRPKMTLGTYPLLGISEARDQHEKLRKQVAQGIDPSEEKKEAAREAAVVVERAQTFAEFARVWIAETLKVRSQAYRTQSIRFIDLYIGPMIGDKPLAEVKPREVLAIMEKYKHIPVTAERCRTLVQQVYNFAIRKLLVDTNPATAMRGAVIVPPPQHHRHLSEPELGAFWCQLDRQRQATTIVVYAGKLLLLTMTRKSELRLAKWEEFDLDAAMWDIPKTRMKMGIAHRVPLSTQAVELLRYMRRISGDGEYVFPTRFIAAEGTPISEATLNHLFKRLDFGVPKFAPHGTRSTAATLLREHGFGKDVVELLLAHTERDRSAAAYSHMQLVDERRRALQFLADRVEMLAEKHQQKAREPAVA